MNTLFRAIDSDADFAKRCGVILNIGDLQGEKWLRADSLTPKEGQ